MPSPEAIFEREAVRSYMATDLLNALGHDLTSDPRVTGPAGVDFAQLWAELIAEVRDLAAARARIAELEGVERATEILVDTMEGIHSNPWDDPNFRVAINEASAALNRE